MRAKLKYRGGVINPADVTLRIPRELPSPNTWNGRHWRVKHRLSQDWEHAIGGAMLDLYVADGNRVNLTAAITAASGPTWAPQGTGEDSLHFSDGNFCPVFAIGRNPLLWHRKIDPLAGIVPNESQAPERVQ